MSIKFSIFLSVINFSDCLSWFTNLSIERVNSLLLLLLLWFDVHGLSLVVFVGWNLHH